jgi:hypothetical protein
MKSIAEQLGPADARFVEGIFCCMGNEGGDVVRHLMSELAAAGERADEAEVRAAELEGQIQEFQFQSAQRFRSLPGPLVQDRPCLLADYAQGHSGAAMRNKSEDVKELILKGIQAVVALTTPASGRPTNGHLAVKRILLGNTGKMQIKTRRRRSTSHMHIHT